MRRTADVYTHFGYRIENAQNPFIGFVSYQHFRDEALYSDVVVVPGQRMIETENFECYPISTDVPQNGRSISFFDFFITFIKMFSQSIHNTLGEHFYKSIYPARISGSWLKSTVYLPPPYCCTNRKLFSGQHVFPVGIFSCKHFIT